MKTNVLLSILLINYSILIGQDLAIKNATVIDVKTGKELAGHSVLITNGKISWIGVDKKLKIGKETKALDATGKYLMPGLIDSHIHFFQSGSLYTRPDVLDLSSYKSYKEERQKGFQNTVDYLHRYLRLGITTVIDDGGPFNNFIIRDSISKKIVSPNILVTGPLFSMVESKEIALNDPPIIKIESTEEADALFNRMLPKKPDFIKVWYIVDREHPAEKSFPIIKHIGELCSKNKLTLAVHATELTTAKLAVDAGAGILVHSIDDKIIPDDFVTVLKEKKVTYIPTLIVMGNYYKAFTGALTHHPQDLTWANAFAYGTLRDLEAMDSATVPSAIKWFRKNGIPKTSADSIMYVNLKKLVKAGVNVATGTDAGNIGTFHASSYMQELEAMKRAGLSNAEILKASTINAATGFGMGDKVGTIETGKMADLLLLTKNPLESIHHINSVDIVFKNGKQIKPDTLVQESPEAIVQRQVNAYNAKNLDAFLGTYADDIEIIHTGKVVITNRDQMKKSYDFINTIPYLFCQIENRIVINNKVIDKEKVWFGNEILHAVAIYEIEKGKIKRVTFVE